MMSLFSSFDSSYFWLTFILFSTFLYNFFNFTFLLGPFNLSILIFKNNISLFFYSLKSKSFNKTTFLMLISLLFFIFSLNFFSVFSFIFPFTSQLSIVMFFSLTLWLSLIWFSLLKNFSGFFSHLVPEGTPLALTFVLFLIEIVSSVIRPITLTVRLVANILAGHLLMILLSNLIFSYCIILPLYLLLNCIELFVALIQTYIYCTMIVLYYSEI